MMVGRAALLVLLLAGSIACAKLGARSQPVPPPPLETPPPPPRVIVPIASEPIVNVAAPPVEAPGPPVEPPSRRSVREPPRAAPPKPEKTEPAPVVSASPPSDSPAPPPALQTTANAVEVEQKVRALLANAARDLGRVDYRTLGVDARAQYDIAKRFGQQAEEALKVRNLVFAQQLADKAAALATLLLQR